MVPIHLSPSICPVKTSTINYGPNPFHSRAPCLLQPIMSLARPSRRELIYGLTGATVGLTLSGCSQNAPVDEQGRVRLRLAAPGPARAEHAGFYQAIADGSYARRGLNVQIFHGNSATDVSQRLAAGQAELGLARDSFAALRMIADRAPVKAVAAFLQKDLRVLIAHGSEAPRDLMALSDLKALGERPLYTEDPEWSDFWAWLQPKYQLAQNQIHRPEGGALEPFLEDPRSLLIGSLTREPALVGATKPDLATRLYLPADDGFASYSGIVLAPNAFARDNTEALKHFIAASAEGWRNYLNGEPDPAHGLIRRANPATPQGSLDTARELLKTHSIVDGGDAALYGLGAMTAQRWETFAEQSRGAYASDPDWREAFTPSYLPALK